nr:unnamed protein product [Digitaria exilis]
MARAMETFGDEDQDKEEKKAANNKAIKVEKEEKKDKHKKKGNVEIVEIEDNSAGCVAIRKLSYRAHLAHRSQVLRCLRDLAVAKAKLKEIRSLFYNISYRRRIAHESEERQRSMLEELEGMLEIVDPQPPGKPRTLSRRKFDLPEGGAIPREMRDGVKNVVRIVEEGK